MQSEKTDKNKIFTISDEGCLKSLKRVVGGGERSGSAHDIIIQYVVGSWIAGLMERREITIIMYKCISFETTY